MFKKIKNDPGYYVLVFVAFFLAILLGISMAYSGGERETQMVYTPPFFMENQ